MMVKLVSQGDEGDDEAEDDDVYEDEDDFERDNTRASKVLYFARLLVPFEVKLSILITPKNNQMCIKPRLLNMVHIHGT